MSMELKLKVKKEFFINSGSFNASVRVEVSKKNLSSNLLNYLTSYYSRMGGEKEFSFISGTYSLIFHKEYEVPLKLEIDRIIEGVYYTSDKLDEYIKKLENSLRDATREFLKISYSFEQETKEYEKTITIRI